MLKPLYHIKFFQDIQLAQKNNKNMDKLNYIIELLINENNIVAKHKNQKKVINNLIYWECHIEPDWLLVYTKTKTEIIFARTRSHSNIF